MADDTQIEMGPAPADAAAVAILVHGRGRSPAEMRDLAATLDLPEVRFVMPGAPGGSWYPKTFLAPLAENEPHLGRSLARYARLIDDLLAAGVPAGRIVLAGFSQGACLTAETLLRQPRRYGGAIVLTGGFIGPRGTVLHPPAPELADVPVYLTGSRIDEWVPDWRVEETRSVLAESGAQVRTTMFEDRPHLVSAEELAAARALLAAVGRGGAGPSR